MADLRVMLAELGQLDGVTAALIVGHDGFVIEGVSSDDIDVEVLGALAASSVGASTVLGADLNKGRLFGLMVEYEQGPVVVSPLTNEAMLVVVASEKANLGRIRLELRKRHESISTSL